MAWIETVAEADAQGPLRGEYERAKRRAGRVFNILKVMSPSPPALEASIALYTTLMHGPSPLSRAQREAIAVVVSKTNRCHY